jgi:hypothetical protein
VLVGALFKKFGLFLITGVYYLHVMMSEVVAAISFLGNGDGGCDGRRTPLQYHYNLD